MSNSAAALRIHADALLAGRDILAVDHKLQIEIGTGAYPKRNAIPGGMRLSDDFVSPHERVFGPASPGHGRCGGHFDGPVLHVASLIGDIQMNQAVGIAPVEGRHCSSKDNRLIDVVVRNAVVRGYRA